MNHFARAKVVEARRRRKAAYDRQYRRVHARRIRWQVRDRHVRWSAVVKLQAALIVAQRWGDDGLRCRKDTLPAGNPFRRLECGGGLSLDHMNGGGSRDRRRFGHSNLTFWRAIVDGRRSPADLRILCQVHQEWNQGANLLDPGEWL